MKIKKTLAVIIAVMFLAGLSPIIVKAEENNTVEIVTEETAIEEIVTEEVATEETVIEEEAIEEETEETEETAIEETVTEEATVETVTYTAVRLNNVSLNNNFEYAIAYVTDVQTGETQKVFMQQDGSSLYGTLTDATVTSDNEYTLTVWNFYQNDEVTVVTGHMTGDTTDLTAMNFAA